MPLPLSNIKIRNTGSRSGKSGSEGEHCIISTGQGVTFGFGLTPALSRQRARAGYIGFSSFVGSDNLIKGTQKIKSHGMYCHGLRRAQTKKPRVSLAHPWLPMLSSPAQGLG